MRMKSSSLHFVVTMIAGSLLLLAWGSCMNAQEPPAKPAASQPKTAAQQFKNIQVLKDIPADQLIPAMQFISASLGENCEFCHVENAKDKDDKKTKLTARKMIAMVLAIDKANFDEKLTVTCYTCHRGLPQPVATPVLSAEAKPKVPARAEEEPATDIANLPTPDQILDKYLAAVGGADALKKIKTRVQKGKIEAFGNQYPVEVFSQAPDKRVSITHPQSGDSVTAFNGEAGWLTIPGGSHFMNAGEREAARLDAELYFPARIRDLYKEFHVRAGEPLVGRPTWLLTAASTTPNRPSLQLYFDRENGLLLRMIRLAQTPLGRNPTEIDYADYRETDGVKIPYAWTLTRPNGSFTIRIDQVQQNVPVDEKRFVAPAEPPAH